VGELGHGNIFESENLASFFVPRILKVATYFQKQQASRSQNIHFAFHSTASTSTTSIHEFQTTRSPARVSKMQHISDSQQHRSKLDTGLSKNSRSIPMNKLTCRHLMHAMKNFAKEFEEFDDGTTAPTPQADLGIGPVNYDIKFVAGQGIERARLKKLSAAVELEKFIGDKLIKLDSSIVCVGYNKEDPVKWLPAALRVGIRTEIRE
jgi:hypothetical protein